MARHISELVPTYGPETFQDVFNSWQEGLLRDDEAILKIIASPGHKGQPLGDMMAKQLAAIAEIARSQQKIMRERTRAQFLTFIEMRVCVEAIGSSMAAQIIECLMAAFDRDEILWQPGQLQFTFHRKGEM